MVQQGRADWLALLARAGTRTSEPGAAGEWTLRDVVAHENAYRRFLVGELGGTVRPFGDMSGDNGDVETRNQILHRQDKDLSWDFVAREGEEVHAELLRVMEPWGAPELDEQFAPWHPWPRWRWIHNLAVAHYDEHIPNIEKWLGAN
jgi:hypothetical protein